MGLRYVWDKFSVSNNITTDANNQSNIYVYNNTYPNGGLPEYINTSLSLYTSLEKVNGVINGVGMRYVPVSINVNAGYMQNISLGGTYYTKDSTNNWYAVSTAYFSLATGPSPNYENYVSISLIGYKADVSVSVGSKLDTVSSNINNTYPNNNQLGDYWYVYKGSDNIDPESINYISEFMPNQEIDVSLIKPVSTYGGTISYLYEYDADGSDSWQTMKNTTEDSIVFLVPESVTSTLQIRVTASDDMGYTSTTPVVGPLSNIITEKDCSIRLHKKMSDNSYKTVYLETSSLAVKVGNDTLEDILTQIESDIAALNG